MTWNPVTGCTKVSPGCKYCYAEAMARRLRAMKAPGYENGFEITLLPERLLLPRKRKKPTTYFICSMSDLFHEDIDFDFINRVINTIVLSPWHTYQILTKRAERMRCFFSKRAVPANAWLGVSVENRKHGMPRLRHLTEINARVKFLSCEPVLEDLGCLDLSGIHWVIVGGESGAKGRPMKPEWVMSLKAQCERYDTALFFKQWGTRGADGVKRSKKSNGRVLSGRTWDARPTDEGK